METARLQSLPAPASAKLGDRGCSPARQKRDHEKHQEYDEQNFSKSRRRTRDAGEAKQAGNESDDQER